MQEEGKGNMKSQGIKNKCYSTATIRGDGDGRMTGDSRLLHLKENLKIRKRTIILPPAILRGEKGRNVKASGVRNALPLW